MATKVYLQQTEHAAKQLFALLEHYQKLLEESIGPVFVTSYSNEDDLKTQRERWHKDKRKEIEHSFMKEKEYLGLYDSQAIICGAILQIAHTGIKAFSKNDSIDLKPKELNIELNSMTKLFCIGRKALNLPIGLIIYAARNQHIHHDEGEYNSTTEGIFSFMSKQHPAFNLSGESFNSKAPGVLSLLGWKTYDKYNADIQQLLSETS